MHGVLCGKHLELLSLMRLHVLASFPCYSLFFQTRGSVLIWLALEEISAAFPLLFFPRLDFSQGGAEELFSNWNQVSWALSQLSSSQVMEGWHVFHCTLYSLIFHRTERDYEFDSASFLGCYWTNAFIIKLLPVNVRIGPGPLGASVQQGEMWDTVLQPTKP